MKHTKLIPVDDHNGTSPVQYLCVHRAHMTVGSKGKSYAACAYQRLSVADDGRRSKMIIQFICVPVLFVVLLHSVAVTLTNSHSANGKAKAEPYTLTTSWNL